MSEISRHVGKYELFNQLGQGNAGEVWKGRDRSSGREVAVKIFHPDLLQSDPHFLHYFVQQKDQLLLLEHSNIVRIRDVNIERAENAAGITAYMVQDYIYGQTLAKYVRATANQGELPPVSEVVYLLMCIGSAIDYAHEQGMVHGNIKPTNILLDQQNDSQSDNGEPMLCDFGTANLPGYQSSQGQPSYLSPEQAQSQPATTASDIYALGIVLYEIFTGTLPFKGNTPASILKQHLTVLPTPPLLINPTIPYSLSEVILRAMEKNPQARYKTASQLMAAVAEACSDNNAIQLLIGTSKTPAYVYNQPQAAPPEPKAPRFNTILGVSMPIQDEQQQASWQRPQFFLPTHKPDQDSGSVFERFDSLHGPPSGHQPAVKPAPSQESNRQNQQPAMKQPATPEKVETATPPNTPGVPDQSQQATSELPANQTQRPPTRTNLKPSSGGFLRSPIPNIPDQQEQLPATPALGPTSEPSGRPSLYQQEARMMGQSAGIPNTDYASYGMAHGGATSPYPPQPSYTPAWQPGPPPVTQPETLRQKYWRNRKKPSIFVPALLVALIILILFSVVASNLRQHTSGSAAITNVGSVFLQDDGLGREDTAHIDLQNLSAPPSGKSYYAWFKGNGKPTFSLGKLNVNSGRVSTVYLGDARHTNLLSVTEDFVITTEDDNTNPTAPSQDVVYTGSFDRTSLPTLKEMLYSFTGSGTDQGTAVNILETIKSINEKAGSIVDYLGGQDTGLSTRQTIRIIELLDGTSYARSSGDLPKRDSPNLNVAIGLLSSPNHIGYIDVLNTEINSLPQNNPHIANIRNAIADLQNWLQKMHSFVVQMLHASSIKDPAVLQLAQQLKQLAADTYTGRTIPPSGSPQPTLGSAGALQAFIETQYLATIIVKPV